MKIPVKAKLNYNSITLENPSKIERYLKINHLQFDFFIQVGQPSDSIVIHNVFCLNWQPVVCFYGVGYWKAHIVCCGINGVLHRNNDVPLPYIRPLFHESVDPFHADATYSPPDYWND